MRILYHEVQESKLCALHCVNTVLQGPVFSEFDLAAMASDLDRAEQQMMQGSVSGDFLPEVSHNVSPAGDFSIQVLTKALEVWDLQVIPLDSPVAEPARIEPQLENAYICHLHNHWFCLRKVKGEWYNFNSLYPAPEHLSRFYLSAYLDSLKGSGWSIFLVRGDFSEECPVKGANEYGQWLSPRYAKRIIKSASRKRNRYGRQRDDGGDDDDDDDDDDDEGLRNAIAASLRDSSRENEEVDSSENENGAEKGREKRACFGLMN